jgi:hypothetical protein
MWWVNKTQRGIMVKQLLNILRLFGNKNVYYHGTESEMVSRINRKNHMYYLLNIMIITMILIFVSLFMVDFFKKKDQLLVFFAGQFFVLLILYIYVRIKEGDTIVCLEEGIKELNWLFSRSIRWEKIDKVYFDNEGSLSKRLPWLKTYFDTPWHNIIIRGDGKKIRISTRFSDNEHLQEYIRSRCKGKIEEREHKPVYNLIILALAIIAIIFWYRFHPFKPIVE